jgi:HK97 family phage portal protein
MAFTLRFSKKGVSWGSEQRSAPDSSGLLNLTDWLYRLFGSQTAAGINVSPAKSLQLSAVYACVRAIAEDVAKLPMHLIKEEQGRRTRNYAHQASYLINQAPNELMNPMEFKQALIACAALWGNGYAAIMRDGAGEIESLDIYHPSLVSVQKVNNRLYYIISGLGTLAADQVVHIKAMSFAGDVGISVVRFAAESMGVSLAAQTFGAAFFGNGANLQGVFTTPNSLGQTAYDRLKQDLVEKKKGPGKAHDTQILEEGLKYERIGVPPNEAQFIETRELGIEEICRWFRVPPHKIAHLTRATHNNVEHMSIEYVTDTLMPWITKLEEELNRKLLTEADKRNHYFKVNANALLRGDTRARAELYKSLWGIGALTGNDVRELEDMNPLEGADAAYVPLNMIPAADSSNYHNSKIRKP